MSIIPVFGARKQTHRPADGRRHLRGNSLLIISCLAVSACLTGNGLISDLQSPGGGQERFPTAVPP